MRTLMLIVLASALASGCALTNYTIATPYLAETPAALPSPVVRATLGEFRYDPSMPLKPQAVGVKKNGYGMDTAEVYVAPDPEAWLGQAIMLELERAGITLVKGAAPAAPAIDVHFEQFFVEPDVGAWSGSLTAVTVVEVQVTVPASGRRLARRFVGEVTTSELAWTDGDFEKNLVASARQALTVMSAEVRALLIKLQGGGNA